MQSIKCGTWIRFVYYDGIKVIEGKKFGDFYTRTEKRNERTTQSEFRFIVYLESAQPNDCN